MKPFSIKEALRFGWQTYKSQTWFLLGVFFAVWIITMLLSSFASGLISSKMFLLGIPVQIIQIAVGIILGMGILYISIRLADGLKATFNDLLAPVRYFWRFLGGSILYALIIVGGLILLIIPGLIWMIKYSMARYLIVDKGMSPVEAIRTSGAITQGVKGQLTLFYLIIIGINILGVLAFFIGLLITIPVSVVAIAYVYRALEKRIRPAEVRPEASNPDTNSDKHVVSELSQSGMIEQ